VHHRRRRGLLLAIAGIGGIVALAIGATAPARDAGHAFLQKLRAHDYDGAWNGTSDAFKKATPRDVFEKQLSERFPEAEKSTDATFSQTSVTNSKACLSGSLAPGSTPIHVRLIEENGAWRVDQIAKERVDGCNN